MSEFSVGEIAIFIGRCGSQNEQTEVEIIGGLCMRTARDPIRNCEYTGLGYEVMSNDEIFLTEEQYLRKKRPPEELSTWEQVRKETSWSPREVTV